MRRKDRINSYIGEASVGKNKSKLDTNQLAKENNIQQLGGDTHEEGGISLGQNTDGQQVEVEGGELGVNSPQGGKGNKTNMILSNNPEMAFNKKDVEQFGLPKTAVGETPAKVLNDVIKKNDIRKNDRITNAMIQDYKERIITAQEAKRQERIQKALADLEQLQPGLMDQMAQQKAQQMQGQQGQEQSQQGQPQQQEGNPQEQQDSNTQMPQGQEQQVDPNMQQMPQQSMEQQDPSTQQGDVFPRQEAKCGGRIKRLVDGGMLDQYNKSHPNKITTNIDDKLDINKINYKKNPVLNNIKPITSDYNSLPQNTLQSLADRNKKELIINKPEQQIPQQRQGVKDILSKGYNGLKNMVSGKKDKNGVPLGVAFDLVRGVKGMIDPDKENYQNVNVIPTSPQLMNYDQAKVDINTQNANTNEAAKNSPNMASYLAMRMGSDNAAAGQLANIAQQTENTNVGIKNNAQAQNAQAMNQASTQNTAINNQANVDSDQAKAANMNITQGALANWDTVRSVRSRDKKADDMQIMIAKTFGTKDYNFNLNRQDITKSEFSFKNRLNGMDMSLKPTTINGVNMYTDYKTGKQYSEEEVMKMIPDKGTTTQTTNTTTVQPISTTTNQPNPTT